MNINMSTDIVAVQKMVEDMDVVMIQNMVKVTDIAMMLKRVVVKEKIKAAVLGKAVIAFVLTAEKKYHIKKTLNVLPKSVLLVVKQWYVKNSY